MSRSDRFWLHKIASSEIVADRDIAVQRRGVHGPLTVSIACVAKIIGVSLRASCGRRYGDSLHNPRSHPRHSEPETSCRALFSEPVSPVKGALKARRLRRASPLTGLTGSEEVDGVEGRRAGGTGQKAGSRRLVAQSAADSLRTFGDRRTGAPTPRSPGRSPRSSSAFAASKNSWLRPSGLPAWSHS